MDTTLAHQQAARLDMEGCRMILTPQQMAESTLKLLEDVVANIYPPEEREEAKARILNAWSAEMFQGRDAK
jgi:hypothetical protein